MDVIAPRVAVVYACSDMLRHRHPRRALVSLCNQCVVPFSRELRAGASTNSARMQAQAELRVSVRLQRRQRARRIALPGVPAVHLIPQTILRRCAAECLQKRDRQGSRGCGGRCAGRTAGPHNRRSGRHAGTRMVLRRGRPAALGTCQPVPARGVRGRGQEPV